MKRFILFAGLFSIMACVSAFSQDNGDVRKKFEEFRNQTRKDYSDFRNKCNQEYADFMRAAWEKYGSQPPIEKPAEEPPVIPEPYVAPTQPRKDVVIKEVEGNKDNVIEVVEETPQPEPAFPIVEKPKGGSLIPNTPDLKERIRQQNKDVARDTMKRVFPEPVLPEEEKFNFSFLGTEAAVRLGANQKVIVSKCKEGTIADCWEKYSSGEYDNLLYDCLKLREKHKLCDWAYLTMLYDLATAYYGDDRNSAVLMTAYIYCQSGYQIRLGMGDEGATLVMLYASKHMIFDKPYFTLEDGENYYTFNYTGKTLNVCKAKFPQEQPLSLLISSSQTLDNTDESERVLQSKKFNQAKATVKINKNLIEFYDKYPASMLGENTMTRWAMYANTPLNTEIIDALYPSLRKSLEGKSEEEALNILLNFVQTAFVYEYDNKVWGHDRVFFAEETLYYPYCDCEDRSILFSRLVRDLMGLDVLLVYYPGHLATAVNIKEKVNGDYIVLDNERYIVCDPTYINAPIGETMPKMDNSTAKLIKLK